LPRDNQRAAGEVVVRRGLTTKQTGRLVASLSAAADDAERRRVLDEHATGKATPSATHRPSRKASSPALLMVQDVAQLCRIAARLEARLLERPLCTYGVEGQAAVRGALSGMGPVLALLRALVEQGGAPVEASR
jgi:hypothetical protein